MCWSHCCFEVSFSPVSALSETLVPPPRRSACLPACLGVGRASLDECPQKTALFVVSSSSSWSLSGSRPSPPVHHHHHGRNSGTFLNVTGWLAQQQLASSRWHPIGVISLDNDAKKGSAEDFQLCMILMSEPALIKGLYSATQSRHSVSLIFGSEGAHRLS
jgi:hypothetical protein